MANTLKSFLMVALAMGSVAAWGNNPVVSGSSKFGCSTEILTNEPVKLSWNANDAALPVSCQDLSGTWEGGCFWAVMKCPKVTPLGDCIMPTADEVYLDNIWTKADLNGEPTEGPKHKVKVTQDGCRGVTIEAAKDTFLGGKINFDMLKDAHGTGFLKFRRSCKIETPRPAEWIRTFEMGLVQKTQFRWTADGSQATASSDYAGSDVNYGATYRRVLKWRLYRTGADQNTLRADVGYWVGNRRYDPPAFEFFVPSFGGNICIWRKVAGR